MSFSYNLKLMLFVFIYKQYTAGTVVPKYLIYYDFTMT